MKKVIMIVLATLLALSCLACTANTPAATEPAAEATVAAEAPAEAAPADDAAAETAKDPADVTIAGLIHVESYVGTMMLQGMTDAANKYGVNLVTTNFNGDASKETEALNTYVAQGVDGIVSSVSETTMDIYRQANAQGIKISMFNAVIENDFAVSGVTYDQAGLGRGAVNYAAKFIKEQLGGVANVHIIRVMKGTWVDARGDAFIEGIKAELGDNVKVVSESSTYIVAEAMQQATDAMTANPDINVIYCEGEDALMGAYAAIQNTGNTGKVFLFGIDGNQQLAEYLLNPDDVILQGTCAQDPYTMANKATENLILTILGQRESTNGAIEYLSPIELNKGDLPTVQTYFDALKAASEK